FKAHLADLAYHFSEAGAWAKALEYGRRAGERARALYAPRAAVEHFTRALDAARHLSVEPAAGLWRERGQAFEVLGDFEQARADHERALAAAHAAGDGRAEWQGLIDLGFLWMGRDLEQTEAFFRRALDLARAL